MKKKPFTLLELLAAMTVFTIFMLAVMRLFGLTQDVMSSSTNNVSQYEKVRIVMDMLAADLQNIYYNEGVDALAYYQQNDASGEIKSLDIPVQRTHKIGKSDVTLSRVHYGVVEDNVKTDAGATVDTGLKNLRILAIGNKDNNGNTESAWALHRYGNEVANVYPDISTDSRFVTILDGIAEMKILPYNFSTGDDNVVSTEDYYKTSTSTKKYPRIPDFVVVKIKLVDDNVLKRVRERKAMGIADEIKDEDCRLFSRRIDIDRGQSF